MTITIKDIEKLFFSAYKMAIFLSERKENIFRQPSTIIVSETPAPRGTSGFSDG